jgi:Exo70 exocyst complex subunit
MFTFLQLFNSGMDALLSQQGEWRVSSSLLREILGTKLLEEIYPYYEDFYNKYSKIQFSKKHMSEYLRFPPEDVERLLQNFFGKS